MNATVKVDITDANGVRVVVEATAHSNEYVARPAEEARKLALELIEKARQAEKKTP